jgi:hypothetical protein
MEIGPSKEIEVIPVREPTQTPAPVAVPEREKVPA